MIPEYQHAYQVSVGKTAQLTADTKELVRSMDKDSLTQLRAQHSPSKEVEMLLSAVIIVGECSRWHTNAIDVIFRHCCLSCSYPLCSMYVYGMYVRM